MNVFVQDKTGTYQVLRDIYQIIIDKYLLLTSYY